jgi:regulator of cell morphogenesis and NO signaling
MTVNANKTVRELAVELTSATRVFEKLGIDYCCGGHRTLTEACEVAKVPVSAAVTSLEVAESIVSETRVAKDWSREPLSELIDHIVKTHHAFVRQELPRIEALLTKVLSKHGTGHPELSGVDTIFAALQQELNMHLMKEEQILFPYIVRLEEAKIAGEPVPPAMFGSVQHPISMMEQEHDGAGEAFRRMHELTDNFAVPASACMSYQELYRALPAFEADLHQHIHLENNILHPRAVAMEGGRVSQGDFKCSPEQCCVTEK